MERENALAEARFKVSGNRKFDGERIETEVYLGLFKSGAFDYGNRTCMIMKFRDSAEQLFDTRYEKVSVKTFKKYAKEFLKNYVAEGLEIEPID